MRSSDKDSLETLNGKYKLAVQEAIDEENKRWKGRGPVSVSNEVVGYRPAGSTPADSAIVRTAIEVTKVFGVPGDLGEGSTDSNVPMSLGIPAITIGGGGKDPGLTRWTKVSTRRILILARNAGFCWPWLLRGRLNLQ